MTMARMAFSILVRPGQVNTPLEFASGVECHHQRACVCALPNPFPGRRAGRPKFEQDLPVNGNPAALSADDAEIGPLTVESCSNPGTPPGDLELVGLRAWLARVGGMCV